MDNEETNLSEVSFDIKFLTVVALCAIGSICLATFVIEGGTPEYTDTHLKVIDKNIMSDEWGEPQYTITFDTGEDVFVYSCSNGVDIYQQVEIGNTYPCTYRSGCSLFGYTIGTYSVPRWYITKINGVDVE